MKYWKEETNSTKERKFWQGEYITKLEPNEVFIFGANPEARHFAGAAKVALKFGAIPKSEKSHGISRGLSPNQQTYALITKNLTAGITVDGITYEKAGYQSVSKEQIRANVDEMYEVAKQFPEKSFIVTYKYESWPNGSPKKSLNGYTSQEMLEMFAKDKDVPPNIVFHESYKPHLEKLYKNQNKQSTGGIEHKTANTETSIEDFNKKYTFFFHLTSPFSNFHPSKFTYKEYTFCSNEQFMMFSKAKNFKDEETAKKIISFNSQPLIKDFFEGKITREEIVKNKQNSEQWNKLMIQIKKLGREVKNYDENFWNKKRTSVVFFGAREKFNQNPDLKTLLLNTEDTLMVEASPQDKLWGIGLSANDAQKIPPEKWPGLNLLGGILTDLKKYYKQEMSKKPKI